MISEFFISLKDLMKIQAYVYELKQQLELLYLKNEQIKKIYTFDTSRYSIDERSIRNITCMYTGV